MKATHIIIASALCSALISYMITSNQYTSQIRNLQQTSADEVEEVKGEMRADLKRAEAGARTEVVETVITETVTVEVNPTEVLQELAALEVTGQNRFPTLRKAVFHLESLSALGEKSIPALREFIATGEDVSFSYSYTRSQPVVIGGGKTNGTVRVTNSRPKYTYFSSSYGNPNSGYLVPPSLRVGLFQIAADIGSTEAEKLLADSLGMAQRGGEAAFLDSLLQEMNPNQYTDLALSVAKDLILNPPEESASDYQHEVHLYNILTKHKDIGFAKEAQNLLVKADGRLNRNTLNYLNNVLNSDAVPMLAKAAQDGSFVNTYERQSLITSVMRYTGQHPQADQMFLEIMREQPELTSNQKYYQTAQYSALNSLSYNVDQETAKKRKALLESVRDNIVDPNLKRAADSASKRLDYRINPQTNPWKRNTGFILPGSINGTASTANSLLTSAPVPMPIPVPVLGSTGSTAMPPVHMFTTPAGASSTPAEARVIIHDFSPPASGTLPLDLQGLLPNLLNRP